MDVLYQAIIVGAGPAGLTAGLYTSRAGLRTLTIEKETPPGLTATRILQKRAFPNPKTEIKCGVMIEAICGDGQVRAVELRDMQTGQKHDFEVDGVLVVCGC